MIVGKTNLFNDKHESIRGKIAAICVWIVAAFLILAALGGLQGGQELRDCIARGGSGSTCPGPGLGVMIPLIIPPHEGASRMSENTIPSDCAHSGSAV